MSVDISDILAKWPYNDDGVMARLIVGDSGEHLLQLRLDLGVLQMFLAGRPDGERPDGYASVRERLDAHVAEHGAESLTQDDWSELDREIIQFYHRRTALLALAQRAHSRKRRRAAIGFFRRAARDAGHNLRAMNFIVRYSNDADYINGHERYRPFVLGQRGLALGHLYVLRGDPDAGIERVKIAIERIERFYGRRGLEELCEQDLGLRQLNVFQRRVRRRYGIDKTLQEQLDDAIRAEDFERAAKLRDEIRERQEKRSDRQP